MLIILVLMTVRGLRMLPLLTLKATLAMMPVMLMVMGVRMMMRLLVLTLIEVWLAMWDGLKGRMIMLNLMLISPFFENFPKGFLTLGFSSRS